MKKILALLLALAMMMSFAACGSSSDDAEETEEEEEVVEAEEEEAVEEEEEEEVVEEEEEEEAEEEEAEEIELVIFAAASMTETMDEIIELYKEVAPNVTIVATYDSSGTLKTQIEEGAYCDIFISAAQKQMNQLDITADSSVNTDGLDFVLSETRINLLENKVVLAVPDDNPADITSFEDLATDKLSLLCIGNEDVPVGSYSLEILEYLGLDVTEMESAGTITYGSNVKEVTTQVSEGTVDAGIIYATDAYSAGLTVVAQATSDMCSQIIYPAAVLNVSENVDAAQAFLDYLQTDEAMEVFESVGFVAAE